MASLRLCNAGDTEWRIEPETVVVWVLLLLFAPLQNVLLALLSFVLHESGHMLAAKRLGFSVCEVRLHPMGALMRLVPIGVAAGEWLITLAGPLANLGTAAGAALFLRLIPEISPHLAPFFMQNLGVGTLNLLPILPMDGGRTLRIALESRCAPRTARRISACVSVATCCLLLGGGLALVLMQRITPISMLFPLSVTMLSIRFLLTEQRAGVTSILRHRSCLHSGKAMEICPIAVDGEKTLRTAAEQVRGGKYTVVWVLGSHGERLAAVGEEELLAWIGRYGADARLTDAINLQNKSGKFAKSVVY